MSIPERARYCVGDGVRLRFAYPRPDPSLILQGKWHAFDDMLFACAPPGETFVMHHESSHETREEIRVRMRADLCLSDGQKSGLFRRPSYYVIETDVPLTDVTKGRFDFGIWWDIAVCADRDAVLTQMAEGPILPQSVLHDEPLSAELRFLLFRNFYADEVSVRANAPEISDRVFELAARHRIPMAEVDDLDFYEGTM